MNYKGFNINTNTTPKPWGATEQQMVQDQIDTLTTGTLQGEKQAIGGHQHTQIVRSTSNVDGENNLVIYPAITADMFNLTLLAPSSNPTEQHPINISSTSDPGAVITMTTSSADALVIQAKSIDLTVVSNLTVNGAAPNNHILLGNGTSYVDAAVPGIQGSGVTGYLPVFTDANTVTASGLNVYKSGPDTYINTPSAGMQLQGTSIIFGVADSVDVFHTVSLTSDSNGNTFITTAGTDKLWITSNSSGDALTIADLGGIASVNLNGSHIKMTCTQFILTSLPTGAGGLPAGCLWNDSGTVKVE